MKIRSDQQRMGGSLRSLTSPCCFSELKPMMLRALRGQEETSHPCHMQHYPNTARESGKCPPALPSRDTAALLMVPCSEGVQANRQVLVKQNGQVGSFRLDLSPVDPAAHRGIPAQIRWVDIQDPLRHRVRKNTH